MPEEPRSGLPPHVTLPLLTLVTEQSLDQDYAHAAARRAAVGSRPPRRHGGVGAVVVVLAVFGLLVTTAALQTTRNASVDETSRAALIAQIDARRAALVRAQDRIGRLRTTNAAREQRLSEITAQAAAAGAEQIRLESVTGFGATRGPGVRLVLNDSGSGLEDEAVRDTDLALLADALWGVGAEAISVNGERLTVLSAFRNVGAAVHVNGAPLSPPYLLEAIGDPRALQADLVESARGQEFLTLVDTYGFEFDMVNSDSLALPGESAPALRWVSEASGVDNEPARPGDGAGSTEGGAP